MAEKNLGRVRLVYQGLWSNSANYKRMDIVYLNGNSYYALVDSINKNPELPENNTVWGILNRRGSLVELASPSVSVLKPNQNPTATTTTTGPDGIDKNIVFGIPRAPKPNATSLTVLNPNQNPSVVQSINADGDFSFTFSLPAAASINLNSTPSITVNPNESPAVRSTSTNGNITLQFDLPRSALLNLGTTGILNPNQNPSVARSVSATGDVTYTFSLPKAAATTIGTVSPLNPNQNPTVSNTGTNGNVKLNFGLPKAATINVGTVETVPTGNSAEIIDVGINGNVVLNFKIPKGDTGGAPKGVYPTLAALQAAFPTGDNGAIYVVVENAQWYYYNNGWLPGGSYTTDNIPALGIKINDLGNFYNGENVELALQEVGQVLTEWDCGVF